MGIGRSGGRSAGNRQASPRRATPREREGIDPPGHSAWEHVRIAEESKPDYRLTPRAYLWLEILALGIWVFACVFIAVVVCSWWGLL